MLLESGYEAELRRVAIELETAGFSGLLCALLELWGFHPVRDAGAAGLLLVERRGGDGAGVTLIRLGEAGGSRHLPFPLVLEDLWRELEECFHRPPRQHIRTAVDLDVGLVARRRYGEARLQSLSDLGGRLVFGRELAREEGVRLRLPLDAQVLELGAKVIYSFPRSEEAGYELGLLFDGAAGEVRQVIRSFVRRRIMAAALALGGETAEAGLSWFRIE